MSIIKQYVEPMKSWIEKFFLFYIVLQPFLDVLSYFGISVSILVRVAVLGIGCIYLLFYNSKKIKWLSISYIFVLGLFMIFHTANNLLIKNPYFFVKEVTYSFKIVYVLVMLLVYYAVFNSIKGKIDWEKIVQRNISINIFVISLVMLLAELTNTGNLSYGTPGKLGHSGWFYSPNDQSAVLAMGIGILFLFFITNKNFKIKQMTIPVILLAIWAMLTIGTKVALFSLVVILFLCVIISVYRRLTKKENGFNLSVLSIIFLLTISIIPLTAIGNNMNITYSDFESFFSSKTKGEEQNNGNSEVKENPIPNPNHNLDINYKVFSGRDRFFKTTLEMYKEAPVSQKLLGMGPGGNYEENLKIIEMDFFDWFFGYGLIGFILFMLPIVYFGLTILIKIFQYKFKQVDRKFLIVGTAVGLGLGIAAIAGHILMNPASGFYFSLLLAYLFILSKNSPLAKN